MPTLAQVKTAQTAETVTIDGGSSPSTAMTVVAAGGAALMPPGFEEAPNRPIVYIGGDQEGGLPFYQWNADEDRKEFVPVNRFSARLIDIKTLVKNAEDPRTRSVKLIAEFETSSGARVAMSTGAKTYSAIGLTAGLAGLSADQLTREIGLYGKVGRNGVTFINVYADGASIRNEDGVALLREARADDVQVEAVEGMLAEIKAKLA